MVRALGDVSGRARVLNNLAEVALDIGDVTGARSYVEECIGLCESSGLKHEYADALDCLAAVAARTEAPQSAAQLIGAAERIRSVIRQPLSPYFETKREEVLASIEEQLGAAEFKRLRSSGQTADPKELTTKAPV